MPDENRGKNPQVSSEAAQWIEKAEHFFDGAERMVEGERPVNADLACLLSHAAAERYLKAFLILAGVVATEKGLREYGHDLSKINNDCIDADSSFEQIIEAVETLNVYKPVMDYPSLHSRPVIIHERKAIEAVAHARKIRELVLEKFRTK